MPLRPRFNQPYYFTWAREWKGLLPMLENKSARQEARSLPTTGRVLVHAAYVYDIVQPFVTFGQETRLNRKVAEVLDPRDGERILDIGCGTGLLTIEIARRMQTGEVIGVDASLPMIDVARRKRAGGVCGFEPGLGEDLPFDDGRFDAVTSALFYHHVDLSVKRRCAAEMMRVLRQGGRILVADIDRPWNWFGRLYAYGGWIALRQPEIKENIDGWLAPILREAGFEDVESVYGTLGCIRVWSGRKV
jgi:ubiquinone/menaquinone biosynthesis C-methylase UbiE